jgi:hypothetical protein
MRRPKVSARNIRKRHGRLLIKVFISWFRSSQVLAEFLRSWLKNVIQFLDPWMSNLDVQKGARWSPALSGELERTDFGIICSYTRKPQRTLDPL